MNSLGGPLQVPIYIKQALVRGLIYQQYGYLRIEAYSDVMHIGDICDLKAIIGYFT